MICEEGKLEVPRKGGVAHCTGKLRAIVLVGAGATDPGGIVHVLGGGARWASRSSDRRGRGGGIPRMEGRGKREREKGGEWEEAGEGVMGARFRQR